MKDYLERMNISFNTYVMGVYNGRIWGDEYVLAAIGKMFNIQISVVSPFYIDIWNIFHDGARKADIVLIVNGMDFGSGRYQISHFSATKGTAQQWKCVGSDIKLKEIALYIGETDGCCTAVDLFNINENNLLLQGTKRAVSAINDLCKDIENICIDRDKILDELKTLNVKVKNFKCFTSYYIEDDYDDGLDQVGRRETMPPAKKLMEVVPSTSHAILKIQLINSRGTDFGQQLIAEALQLMDDEHHVAQIHSPRKKIQKSTDVQRLENREKGDVTEELLEEGEIVDKDTREYEVSQALKRFSSVETGIVTGLHKSKKRKTESEEKSQDIETKSKRSKEVIERSVQQRRCRVKMLIVGRPKASDIPPLLPSLGRYKGYIDTEVPDDNRQETREFPSSVPLEGQLEIQPSVFEDVETSEVIDLDMELDIQNVPLDVQGSK